MEQALAYVCCPADESRAKVQKYCRKIYELGYVPICPQYAFAPFLDDGVAEEQQDKTKMSHLILKRCRMVVVCGKEVSGTMNSEIDVYKRQLPISRIILKNCQSAHIHCARSRPRTVIW